MSFIARFPGRCADCELPIAPGSQVMYDAHDDLVHLQCPDQPDDVSMGDGPPCGRCFCYHRGECVMAQRWTCTGCTYSMIYRTAELAEALFPKHVCKPAPPEFLTFPRAGLAAAVACRWPTLTRPFVSGATRQWRTC